LSQIELKFINRYHDTWPAAIACMSGGIVKLDGLIYRTFPIELAEDAMNLASDPQQYSIKVQVVDDLVIQPESWDKSKDCSNKVEGAKEVEGSNGVEGSKEVEGSAEMEGLDEMASK
jgi:hypothetical protein